MVYSGNFFFMASMWPVLTNQLIPICYNYFTVCRTLLGGVFSEQTSCSEPIQSFCFVNETFGGDSQI